MKRTIAGGMVALALSVTAATAGEKPKAAPAQPVTCTGADDCAVKWGRALTWVLDNSHFPVRVQTDSLIQTAGPTPNDAWASYTVSKVPTGDGTWSIDFRAVCDNMFGCVPKVDKSRAAFASAVMGADLATR